MAWKALASVGAAIFGGAQKNKMIDKQLKAQSDENEKNRAYNLQLAKMQNKWNFNMWKMENAYNSPSAQMQRLAAAGLNPDMMYGGGVSGNLSASSPSMTSGAPSSPMDWSNLSNKKSLGEAAFEAAQLDNLRAQTEKIKAETEGQYHTNDMLENDAKFREALNQNELRKGNSEIRLNNSLASVNDETVPYLRQQVKECFAHTEVLAKTVDLYSAQISNYNADTAYKQVKTDIDKNLSTEQIKSMAAKRNLDYAEAKRILDELPYLITGHQDQHGMMIEQGVYLKKQGDILQLQIDREQNNPRHNDGMWKHIYQGVDFVNDVMEAISPVIGQAPTSVQNYSPQYLMR